MKKPELRERDIQRQICDWMTLHRIFWRRSNTGAAVHTYKGKTRMIRFGQKGMADLFAVIRGRHIAIEVKRPGESPTADQEQFGKELEAAGGVYIVADCIEQLIHDIEEVQK
jgi:hypothetical protein